MTNKVIAYLIAAFAGATLTACAANPSSADVYSASQTQREQTVRMGVIEEVRAVKIDQHASGLGLLGGAAVGAVAGSAVGKGKGSILMAIAGGLAGAMAGQAIDHAYNTGDGLELTVRLDNGDLRAITQANTGETFQAGDRVRLLASGGKTRVTH